MRYYPVAIVLLIFGAVSGCWSGEQRITDCERYASGELKSVGAVTSISQQKLFSRVENRRLYGHKREYYENGRLKSEQWSGHGSPLARLEFHENGRLKSEERFRNGQITYAAYYNPQGELENTVGQKTGPERPCRQPNP
jgi:antitoxin component YwqK of YwqJK toxin-antitoxin module